MGYEQLRYQIHLKYETLESVMYVKPDSIKMQDELHMLQQIMPAFPLKDKTRIV